MKHNRIVLIFALAFLVVAVGFPTPHQRVSESFTSRINLNQHVESPGRRDIVEPDVEGHCKFVVSVSSEAYIRLSLFGYPTKADFDVDPQATNPKYLFYFVTGILQMMNITRSEKHYRCVVDTRHLPMYPFEMVGYVDTYRIETIQQWLPWWMP